METISKPSRKLHGFTIVELLIVIVVIAILAAIVMVAYNGIQNRAHAAAAQSAASDLSKLLSLSYATNSSYPADLSTINNGQPMPTSGGTTYSYHQGSGGSSYCATVTNGNSSYQITDTTSSPAAGGCPGDGVNGVAAITNLLYNPSLENNSTANNWGYFSSPLSIDTTTAAKGTMSLKTTTNSSTNPQGIVFAGQGVSAGTYTCSMYIAGTAGTSVAVAGRTETPYAEGMGGTNVTLSNSFQRVSVTFTLAASVGTLEIQARLNTPASGVIIWGDGAMCTSGSTVYNYADGNSPNWIWNGSANGSTSTGPPQ